MSQRLNLFPLPDSLPGSCVTFAKGSKMSETKNSSAKMSVAGATFMGLGAMVGAGIFALLGEAGAAAAQRSGCRS